MHVTCRFRVESFERRTQELGVEGKGQGGGGFKVHKRVRMEPVRLNCHPLDPACYFLVAPQLRPYMTASTGSTFALLGRFPKG